MSVNRNYMKTRNKRLFKKTIPDRYFNELLSGHTVPRFENTGKVILFIVGREYKIINSQTNQKQLQDVRKIVPLL